MRRDSTDGPGNLSKANSGTRRYMVTFFLSKDGQSETRTRAWRAPTQHAAMSRVEQHDRREGYVCTLQSAVEIPNSYKP